MPTADGGVKFAHGSYYRAAQHWRRAAAFIERTSFALLTGRRVQRTIRRIGSGTTKSLSNANGQLEDGLAKIAATLGDEHRSAAE
jgi:hypothetical protein